MVPRGEAYAADITYGTNSEFGFDYLRDNMTMRMDERVQRGHYYAIVDEVDNVLIDEARTPLIISGPAQDEAEWYIRMAQVVRSLRPEDYEISEHDRNVTLTELGEAHVEELLGMPLRDPDRPEDVTPEQARLLGYLEQALRAQYLFRRNKDYLVQAGKVVIVDEFTGRLMPGRRWSDGLHQAVEAKEGVRGPSGERHLRHHHHPELFPHVREAGGHERYGPHRSGRVRQNLQAGCRWPSPPTWNTRPCAERL